MRDQAFQQWLAEQRQLLREAGFIRDGEGAQ